MTILGLETTDIIRGYLLERLTDCLRTKSELLKSGFPE
jgi:hypothetical protein